MKRLHEDAIRRIAGRAFARIAESGETIRQALRSHHATPTRRKAGVGPFANALLEIDAMERRGIDCSPLLAAMVEVQMDARGAEAMCPLAYHREETAAEGRANDAQVALLTGQPGAWQWFRQVTADYVVVLMRGLRLKQDGAR